jgi:mannose/fructose-specific phosphotransferase system component IIA
MKKETEVPSEHQKLVLCINDDIYTNEVLIFVDLSGTTVCKTEPGLNRGIPVYVS